MTSTTKAPPATLADTTPLQREGMRQHLMGYKLSERQLRACAGIVVTTPAGGYDWTPHGLQLASQFMNTINPFAD